jgi:anthranilate phosphoribosyltransferase
MKHAAGVRKELGFRTIFNLLGPLTNPAGAHAQVIGVFDARWVTPLAEVLRDLGSAHAYVVHGEDGLDEITLTGKTQMAHLCNGKVEDTFFNPEDYSLLVCKLQDLQGGSPDENADIIRQILAGQSGPKMDIVLINAAAAIHASDKTSSLQDGLDLARESIRSGAAKQKLDDLCRVTQS